jgi:hypothetical protein
MENWVPPLHADGNFQPQVNLASTAGDRPVEVASLTEFFIWKKSKGIWTG